MHHYIRSFSSPLFQGWLNKKARTGLRKTWTRRYFILDLQQLRCYKNDQPDSLPISIFDLREYQLQNQSSNKPFTFQLIHQTSKASLSVAQTATIDTTAQVSKTPSPDLYLQAENEYEWSNWVDTLDNYVGDQSNISAINSDSTLDFSHQQKKQPFYDDQQQVDVLDKWLERYDLIVPRADRSSPSLLSLAPSSFAHDNDDMEEDYDTNNLDMDGSSLSHSTNGSHLFELPSTPSTKASSSRFLGFLWTVNTKKMKVSSSGNPSPLGSDTL